MILIATFIMHHITALLVEKAGWIEFRAIVFIVLGLGGRSVSFGDRNASLGEFRFGGN